ncbi:MAG: hypothetical protein C0622_02335 [Desulfuromonas sp.]|mgnify:CR=1 FL=1|nr:MAG: hypothetical protein C0622_02335 [Desulfuromonas sp.]
MMKLPQLLEKNAVRLLDEFCILTANDKHQPRHVRYQVEGNRIFLYEIRRLKDDPQQHRELPMAQFRYVPELKQWSLHHKKGEYWQMYLNTPPTLEFGKLLQTVKQDPMGFFWQE